MPETRDGPEKRQTVAGQRRTHGAGCGAPDRDEAPPVGGASVRREQRTAWDQDTAGSIVITVVMPPVTVVLTLLVHAAAPIAVAAAVIGRVAIVIGPPIAAVALVHYNSAKPRTVRDPPVVVAVVVVVESRLPIAVVLPPAPAAMEMPVLHGPGVGLHHNHSRRRCDHHRRPLHGASGFLPDHHPSLRLGGQGNERRQERAG